MIRRLPLWLRRAVVDLATSFVAAVVVLNFGTNVRDLAVAMGVAFGTAALGAFARALPAFSAWLNHVFGVDVEDDPQ